MQSTLLISVPVLLELSEVLGREKFSKYLLVEERMRFLIALLKETELVEVTYKVSACRDPKDNKFLELALSGEADMIISGDNDLLVLNPFLGISILTPQEFLSAS